MTNTYAGDMYHTNPIQAEVILNIYESALILIPHNFFVAHITTFLLVGMGTWQFN